MSYTAPPTGNPSVNRVDGGPLDLSGFGGDAVNLGSNQLTNTGRLADFSQPSNPYHLTFEIEEGDPHVFNNMTRMSSTTTSHCVIVVFQSLALPKQFQMHLCVALMDATT